MKNDLPVWLPGKDEIENSFVARFIRYCGFESYEALHRFSIEQDDQYWRKYIEFSGFVWKRDHETFVHFERGVEFPQWFIGGQLNWVDSVLRWSDDTFTADRPAIIAERESGHCQQVTYKELAQKVRAFANGLRQIGIKRGDRVGMLMENGVEANVSLIAISYIGAVAVPLFTGFGVDAIISRLASCDARLILATTGFPRRGRFVDAQAYIRDAVKELPSVEHIYWKPSPEGSELEAHDLRWSQLLAHSDEASVSESMDPNDPFLLIYTSGTTGKPKGPVHTHAGFPLKMAHDSNVHINIGKGDVLCWPADMGWIAGPIVSFSALLNGATLVTYDGAPDTPDWGVMGSLIEKYRVTHFGASPTLIRGLQAHASDALAHDFSSIKVLITAGESITPEHHYWFQTTFGRGECPIINITGGTEVSCALLSSVVVKPIAPSCFNTTSPAVSADVVDASGQSVTGEIGELVVRKPFVGMCSSFWRDDKRYLESYWQTISGIWVHGDLALHDTDGYYYLLGRSDDTIKVAGKRLGPAEVEAILVELPQIADVAAIGVADAMKGNRLVVFLTPKPDFNGDPEVLKQTVMDLVQSRMGKPFRPSEVYVASQLPKTRSTKVMRRLIRNVYMNAPYGDLSSLDNPAALDELKHLIPRV
ncbi:AMP-binding protein [Orrella marina]|nr:AMP-binding protein [Orrella marina]